MRGKYLNKQEALAVLRQILDVLSESMLISGVSLDLHSQVFKDPTNTSYIIRIKGDMNNYSKDCLNPILVKHRLSLKEERGYLVISPI
jgi:hypothetical protein